MCRHIPVCTVRFARIKMVVQEMGDPYVEYDIYDNTYDRNQIQRAMDFKGSQDFRLEGQS